MKNNSDSKFSYQQLPVSLKLIYTILQVLVLNNWILKWRHKQTWGIHRGFSVIYLSVHVVRAESHVSFVFRKCPSLRSLTSCSTCWTVWRSCVSTESVCTSPARITPSFWLTSRKRCSSRGVCRVIVLVEIVAFNQLCDNSVCVSNSVFVFQPVVHVEIRVLPAGLPGCASASSRPLPVARGWHLLEPHQHKLQQQRLENTIWSRWAIDSW